MLRIGSSRFLSNRNAICTNRPYRQLANDEFGKFLSLTLSPKGFNIKAREKL
jgi:hypothetical protein